MPPRRTAKAPVETKEPVKKVTRTTKNKRELSDDELDVDSKKKKITDKVPSNVTTVKQTKSMASKRKQQTEPVEEAVELTDSQPTVNKRKRAATSKDSKSAKIKKDANDNELIDEDQLNEENGACFSEPAPTTKKGRGKKQETVVEEQPKRRAGGRSKKATVAEIPEPVAEEPIAESQPTTKRGRGRARKGTESATEEVEQQPAPTTKRGTRGRPKANVEPEVPSSSQPEKTTRRAASRGKKITETKIDQQVEDTKNVPAEQSDHLEETAIVPEKNANERAGRGRKNVVVEKEVESVEQSDENETEKQLSSAKPVQKKGRAKVKATFLSEPVVEETKNEKSVEKQVDDHKDKSEVTNEEQLPAESVIKRGRGRTKAVVTTSIEKPIGANQQDVQEESPLDEDLNQEEQLENEKVLEAHSQPTKQIPKRGRGRAKAVVTTSIEKLTESDQQEPQPEANEENETEKSTETDSQPTTQIPKRGRGRAKAVVTTSIEKLTEADQQEPQPEANEENETEKSTETDSQPTTQIPKRGRGRAKAVVTTSIEKLTEADQQDVQEDSQPEANEQPKDQEILETQSQPTKTELISNKRGRKPSRKVQENNELITQSQPVANSEVIEHPIAMKKSRGRGRKAAPVLEEAMDEIALENEKKMELDDFDDNSEKDLVIDLPEEQPKKQSRGRKAKDLASSVPVEKDIEEPAPKRGRAKKQQSQEVPSTALSQQEELETDKVVQSSSNENLIDQQTFVQKKVHHLDTEEITVKRPAKRGRKAVETVEELKTEKQVEMAVDKEPKSDGEKANEEDSQVDQQQQEVSIEDTAEFSKKDQSIMSSDESIKQNEIDNVIEFMKSHVEKSVLEEASLVQSSTSDIAQDETSSSSLNDTMGEIIPAKDLEETYAELPNVSGSSDDLKLTYDSITFKANFSKTTEANTINSISELEVSERKRMKLSHLSDQIELPIVKNGKILTFGDNQTGELGIGKVSNGRSQPIQIAVQDEFCYVHTLSQHSACINSKGQLYTFGNNDECALGRVTATSSNSDADDDAVQASQRKQEFLESTPTICDINSFRAYKATCGDSHTAVLTTKKSVIYWGNFRDNNGSVGLSVNKLSATLDKERIDSEFEIVDIASGANFLLLLDSFGTVYSLGIGDCGQLGRLENEQCKFNKKCRELYLEPKPIEFPKNVKIDAIWAGEFTALARSVDNRIFAWGLNNYCQLGFKQQGGESNEDQCVLRPKEVPYFTKLENRIEKIACGQHHSIALDDHGNVYAFGRGEYGRLGLGKAVKDAEYPKMIETFKNTKVTDISCGASTSFAVASNGKLYSWGMESKQLGQGKDAEDTYEPTEVKINSLENFLALKVSAGSSHCLVLGQVNKQSEINNNAVRNGL